MLAGLARGARPRTTRRMAPLMHEARGLILVMQEPDVHEFIAEEQTGQTLRGHIRKVLTPCHRAADRATE